MIAAVDLFTGCGGFTAGAELAGARVIAAVNHNPDAIEWHARNHPDTRHVCQDVNELDMRGLPEHDLLLASPCCQGFSPSGRPGQSTAHRVNRDRALDRRSAARGTAWAVIRAAEVRRPRTILVENVQEMRSWELWDAWRGCLEALGYAVTAQVVLATSYGATQERQRLLVAASRDRAPRIPAPVRGLHKGLRDDLLTDDDLRCRWVPLASKTSSIQARLARARARADYPDRGVWFNVDSARFRDPYYDHWPTVTTKSLSQGYLIDGDRIRRLEARELARAQGLPDSYAIPSKRTLAGLLIGNMIPVSLSRALVSANLN